MKKDSGFGEQLYIFLFFVALIALIVSIKACTA